jgi:hypothetical protein
MSSVSWWEVRIVAEADNQPRRRGLTGDALFFARPIHLRSVE